MSAADDFRSELPTADVCLGKTSSIRTYGFADIEPRLVEMRINRRRVDDVLRLTVEQARALGAGLIAAAERASR